MSTAVRNEGIGKISAQPTVDSAREAAASSDPGTTFQEILSEARGLPKSAEQPAAMPQTAAPEAVETSLLEDSTDESMVSIVPVGLAVVVVEQFIGETIHSDEAPQDTDLASTQEIETPGSDGIASVPIEISATQFELAEATPPDSVPVAGPAATARVLSVQSEPIADLNQPQTTDTTTTESRRAEELPAVPVKAATSPPEKAAPMTRLESKLAVSASSEQSADPDSGELPARPQLKQPPSQSPASDPVEAEASVDSPPAKILSGTTASPVTVTSSAATTTLDSGVMKLAPPSQVDAPAPPPAPTPREIEFASNNHERLVTSIRTQLLPKGGSMQIRLDPPQLGTLQVAVRMQEGVMSISFQTSNEAATTLLSHSLTQLKHVLESQGVAVDKLHVQQAPRDQESSRHEPNQQQRDSNPHDSSARQEQHRREMLQRMWRRLALGNDPLDLVA